MVHENVDKTCLRHDFWWSQVLTIWLYAGFTHAVLARRIFLNMITFLRIDSSTNFNTLFGILIAGKTARSSLFDVINITWKDEKRKN